MRPLRVILSVLSVVVAGLVLVSLAGDEDATPAQSLSIDQQRDADAVRIHTPGEAALYSATANPAASAYSSPTPAEQQSREPVSGIESARPVTVRIPQIGVDAELIDLGLNPDGTLEVPADFALTGWYTGRSVPGELGPSVVVGHVDSVDGPAVFYRLSELHTGDVVYVDRTDGLVASFQVVETRTVDKRDFPTEAVYGATPDATLRLVTCGGQFDTQARSYTGNLIVFAKHLGNFPVGHEPASR